MIKQLLPLYGLLAILFGQGVQKFGADNAVAQPYTIETATSTQSATTTRFFGSVTPQVNNLYDLGAPNFSWGNIYASGTAYLGTIVVGPGGCTGCSGNDFNGQSSFNLVPTTNQTFSLGVVTSSWSEIYASSTAHLSGVINAGSFLVTANNLWDAGSPTTSLRNAYVSGTAEIRTLVIGAGGCTGCTSSPFTGGQVSQDLFPNANNTLKLGYPTSSWSNLYVSSTAQLGGGVSTTNISPMRNAVSDIGSPFLSYNNIYASGTVNATVYNAAGVFQINVDGAPTIGAASTYFRPFNDNAVDLGTNAAAWKGLYVSSTAFLNAVTVDGHITPNTANTRDLGAVGTEFRSIYATSTSRLGAITAYGSNIPHATNLLDLGSSSIQWRSIYATGTSQLGAITAFGSNIPAVANLIDLGSSSLQWRSIYATGTSNLGAINAFGHYTPNATNLYDIGSASRGLRNVYVSGTIALAGNGNITSNGSNAKRTIVLSAAGGWGATTTNSVQGPTAISLTNGQVLQVQSFSATTTQYIQWTFPMVDSYDGGTLGWKVYWTSTSTNSGNVVWGMQCRSYADGEALDASWGTAATTSDLNAGSLVMNSVTSSAALTIGGSPAGGQEVQCRAYRDTVDIQGTAMSSTVNLLSIKMEYGTKSFSD